MTAVAPQPIITRPRPVRPTVKGSTLLGLLQTTDHKVIGMLYLVTSMAFFFIGGSMALVIFMTTSSRCGCTGSTKRPRADVR